MMRITFELMTSRCINIYKVNWQKMEFKHDFRPKLEPYEYKIIWLIQCIWSLKNEHACTTSAKYCSFTIYKWDLRLICKKLSCFSLKLGCCNILNAWKGLLPSSQIYKFKSHWPNTSNKSIDSSKHWIHGKNAFVKDEYKCWKLYFIGLKTHAFEPIEIWRVKRKFYGKNDNGK